MIAIYICLVLCTALVIWIIYEALGCLRVRRQIAEFHRKEAEFEKLGDYRYVLRNRAFERMKKRQEDAKMKKAKPVEVWCAKSPEDGTLDLGTIGRTEDYCWQRLVSPVYSGRDELIRLKKNYKQDGWRVVPVTITED